MNFVRTRRRYLQAAGLAICLIGGAGCGPVKAWDCEIAPDHRHGTVLRARLRNFTSKPIKLVGVLAGNIQYDFPGRIAAYTTTERLTGAPSAGIAGSSQSERGRIPDSQCWARWVDFADGSHWDVSPL